MSKKHYRRSGCSPRKQHGPWSGQFLVCLGLLFSAGLLGLACANDPLPADPPDSESPWPDPTDPAPIPPDSDIIEWPSFAPIPEDPGTCSTDGLATSDSVNLGTGAAIIQATDVYLPASVSNWSQTRTISSDEAAASSVGTGWLSNNVDYRLVRDSFSGDVTLLQNASSKRVFALDEDNFLSPDDSDLTLEYNDLDLEYVLTNTQTGKVHVFNDFSGADAGLLKESTSVAAQSEGMAGVLYSYDSGQLTQLTSPDGQDYNIVFSYTGSNISGIEVRTGLDTATRVEEVGYTYFDSGTHSADVGPAGSLAQVTTKVLKSGGAPGTADDWLTLTRQYRYDSNGLIKAVFEPAAIQRIIDDRADISSAADILTKGDDDDNSGAADHTIAEYASRRFTYYSVNVKTDNSGAGTAPDPKCETVWAPTGENLQAKYGGTDVDEVDTTNGVYLVKSVSSGGCSSCGGSGVVTKEFFYLDLDHGTPDANEVVRIVVEDTIDADGSGVSRKVYGLNDDGRSLREVVILDPAGTPQFWCRSWILEESGKSLNKTAECVLPQLTT